MKKVLIISLFIVLAVPSFSQKYIEEITEEICQCLENIPDTLDYQKIKVELGLCMLNAAIPYKKQIKKDFDIDLNNLDDKEGEKLGRLFGLKMATNCPNNLIKLTQQNTENNFDTENTIRGVITKTENDFFVKFSVKDINGKTSKFYWLTFIETNTDLPETYQSITGKNVEIKYTTQEFFDPRIGEYRPFKIILSILFID